MLLSARIGGFPGIRLSWAFAGGVCILLAATGANGQCQYEVTVIQAPDVCGILGPVNTFGNGLNENGAVVGRWKCPVSEHSEAFVWTPDSGLTTLARRTGVRSASATDISDNGVIVGGYTVTNVGARGFVYEGGIWTELPPVMEGGGARSGAFAINNEGIVVGQRSVTQSFVPYTAYSWTAADGFTDLGKNYGRYSRASDINDAGIVTGSIGPFLNDEAFYWQGGKVALLGPIPGGFSSTAGAINHYGQIAGVGGMQRPTGEVVTRAFFWNKGVMVVINPLPEYDTSTSRDLNDKAQVVGDGYKLDNPNDRRGFLWLKNGLIYDLNDLVPAGTRVIRRGRAINNRGQIVADAGTETFLLSPIDPSPTDLDGDCRTDRDDLMILIDRWGTADLLADFNSDGAVNVPDLLRLLANWTG